MTFSHQGRVKCSFENVMRVNVYVYIYNTPNVLNLQDFVAEMLNYLKGCYYILNATLPVVNIT